jgi:outer membrane protein OmpA-like peptidoglycan-associated protein
LNGLNDQAELRSVNMMLDVSASTKPASRAGQVRAAAFYLEKSAVLSVEGAFKLRNMVASIPVGARDATINIVGVSVSMDTRSENIKLARERAEVIADYLEAKGVKGSYNLTIMTSYEVRSSSGSIDKALGSDKPASSADGKPLTTTTIDFVALA